MRTAPAPASRSRERWGSNGDRRASALRSHLLVGTVRHRRTRLTTYDFTHHVWYLALDLDELDEVTTPLAALGPSSGVPSLRCATTITCETLGTGLRASVDEHLQRTWGLILPRFASPSSPTRESSATSSTRSASTSATAATACYDTSSPRSATPTAAREVYDFAPDGAWPGIPSTRAKRMYVSPFIGPDARYDLAVCGIRQEACHRDHRVRGGTHGRCTRRINVAPRPLSARHAPRRLSRDPLVPLKTVFLIAWHARRLGGAA